MHRDSVTEICRCEILQVCMNDCIHKPVTIEQSPLIAFRTKEEQEIYNLQYVMAYKSMAKSTGNMSSDLSDTTALLMFLLIHAHTKERRTRLIPNFNMEYSGNAS